MEFWCNKDNRWEDEVVSEMKIKLLCYKNKLFEKTYPAIYYILIGQRAEYANKKIVRCGE